MQILQKILCLVPSEHVASAEDLPAMRGKLSGLASASLPASGIGHNAPGERTS
jgi:hypothetical protein